MLTKATRLHPGEPLQVYVSVRVHVLVDMVVAEVVVDGMVVVEATVVDVVVVGSVVAITESII